MKWPCGKYRHVTSKFGQRKNPITGKDEGHNGIDLAAPRGTPVEACGRGRVKSMYENDLGGKQLIVVYENEKLGPVTCGYAHLDGYAPGLVVGEYVCDGQTLAYVGSTGASTGFHLHLVVRVNGSVVDPLTHLDEE